MMMMMMMIHHKQLFCCWDKMKAYFQIKNKTNIQYKKIRMIKIHMQKELMLCTSVTNRCD